MDDTISRQEAINALRKALYEYEDKTEKQFQESEDIYDWIVHRIYAQNMNDIDVQKILDLPSAERHGRWEDNGDFWVNCSVCGEAVLKNDHDPLLRSTELYRYCPSCGARMDLDEVTE